MIPLKVIGIAALLGAPALAAAQAPEFLPEREELFIVPEGKQGCWVSFFAGENFTPPSVQFTGRTFIESFEPQAQAVVEPPLQKVGGAAFMKTVDSVVVGPHARVEGYRGERFGSRSLDIGPGQEIGDLARVRFHERVQSLKIFCVP